MTREKVKQFVEKSSAQNFIITLIIINSITIGMETSSAIINSFGRTLLLIDKIILAIFVIEILLKLYAYGFGFFKSGWNVFDFAIVGIALLPASGVLAVLRSLRIFRSLRLIKNLPRLRFIVESLLLSLPSIGWIFVLLTLVFYVYSVIGTKLFGSSYPELFGTIWASMFSLFQIMTLEGWADIARTLMERSPFSNIYFISFILIASYTTLNIFIAIVVNTMSEIQQKISAQETGKIEDIIQDEKEELRNDIRNLKEQIIKMEEKLSKKISAL
ncbi:MAG: ion transporter [Ignavibacteriaceae bacterium]|nr:ion transporter [Ignavibacteriaceae bacterium]